MGTAFFQKFNEDIGECENENVKMCRGQDSNLERPLTRERSLPNPSCISHVAFRHPDMFFGSVFFVFFVSNQLSFSCYLRTHGTSRSRPTTGVEQKIFVAAWCLVLFVSLKKKCRSQDLNLERLITAGNGRNPSSHSATLHSDTPTSDWKPSRIFFILWQFLCCIFGFYQKPFSNAEKISQAKNFHQKQNHLVDSEIFLFFGTKNLGKKYVVEMFLFFWEKTKTKIFVKK